ncbi:MAG TPA: thermonuclease family protein [Pyrinomonadaceae bacterium]|nr:thermonuclease family protein [Pyrinomonadaceae bacterium]
MKNLASASLLFVLLCVCALPCVAQKKQPAGAKTGPKPAQTAPPKPVPSTATTAPKAATEQAGVIQGKVVDLGWGDSLTVLDAQSKRHRVRLLGIDAPEKEQSFGPAARQKLSALVFGKTVAVKYQKIDRSGRPLGKVLLGTTDVNLEMLKAGLAWYYANDSDLPESDRPLYAGAEQEARRASRGLWQDETQQPPWEFRAFRKQAVPTTTAASLEPPLTPEDVVVPEQTSAPDKEIKNPEQPAPAEQAEAPNGFPKPPKESITGDSSTKTYFKSSCPEVEKVAAQNRVPFNSIEEAEQAGFKRTPNCP